MSAMEDKITSLLAEGKVFQPPEQGRDQAWVKSMEEYKKAYAESMADPEGFWILVALVATFTLLAGRWAFRKRQDY